LQLRQSYDKINCKIILRRSFGCYPVFLGPQTRKVEWKAKTFLRLRERYLQNFKKISYRHFWSEAYKLLMKFFQLLLVRGTLSKRQSQLLKWKLVQVRHNYAQRNCNIILKRSFVLRVERLNWRLKLYLCLRNGTHETSY